MTELFAVTRTGLVDQSRDPRTGSFSLKRQCVHWFLIKPEGEGWNIRQEGLPFDEETLAWIEAKDRRPTFRVKGNLALVDFAVAQPVERGADRIRTVRCREKSPPDVLLLRG